MMYYKMIGDRMVFSDCRVINLDGHDISNPSSSQIELAGWQVYVPPIVPPTPQTEPGFDEIMQAVKKMLSSEASELSDEDALAVASIFPTGISKLGELVKPGERLGYDEKLYKVIQSHTVQSDGTPDVSASLFTEISIIEGPNFVPPTGREDSYMIGDKVTFEGKHYICKMDYNVYSPTAYPAGWEEQN